MKIENDLVLEDLQCKGLQIYQSKSGYRFTSDAVALANYLTVKNNGILVDLCSGSGVIGILANAKNNISKVIMVELQTALAEMSLKSIEINKLANIEIINSKLQGIHQVIGQGFADTVVCNPPYFTKDKMSKDNTEKAIARNEITVTLREIIDFPFSTFSNSMS